MIPFVDLGLQYRNIAEEVNEAVLDVFASTQFVLGREVAAFEELFADYVSSDRALGVNSGTSALHLAMLAAGLGPGDEVITTPMTFIATVSAIDYTGATPVFVDIDPVTLNIDPALIEDSDHAERPKRSCRYTSMVYPPISTRSWTSLDATV